MSKPRRTAADGLSRWRTEGERREVNEALDRGATWREIATICAKHGRKGVTAVNVSNYRKSSARREWLATLERLESIRRESDATAAVIRHYSQHGGSPAEAGLLAAAEILTKALGGMTESTIQAMMSEDPRKFLSAIESLSKITSFVQRERRATEAAPVESATAISQEERASKLKEIFGIK